MQPNIYYFLDFKVNNICYVGKHNGNDNSYVTGGKILLRYKRRYGKQAFENRFKKHIIEYCDLSKLDEREIYWIRQYGTFLKGLNRTKGGYYDYRRRSENNLKKVLKYDMNGSFMGMYEGVIKTATLHGIHRDSISSCINGKQKSAGGFIWVSYEGSIPEKIEAPVRKEYKERKTSSKNIRLEYGNEFYDSINSLCNKVGLKYKKVKGLIKKGIVKKYIRKIKCIETGKMYDSIDKVCLEYGFKRSTLISWIDKGIQTNQYNFKYVLVNESAL